MNDEPGAELRKQVRFKRCDDVFTPRAREERVGGDSAWLLRCICDGCASPVEQLVVRRASALHISTHETLVGREVERFFDEGWCV